MKPLLLPALLLLASLRPTQGAGTVVLAAPERSGTTPPPVATLTFSSTPVTLPSLLPVPASPAAPKLPEAVALKPGESFTFRVGWGLFSGAGEVRVFATADTLAGKPQTRVTTQTETKGVIGMLYSFTGEAVAHFDAADGLLTALKAVTQAGSKQTKMTAAFDYPHSQAAYVDPLRPARSATLPMPSGRPMDLITVLIQARAWNLKPGETHPALVLFDNEFYQLTVTAQRVEKISTDNGNRDAMLLIPTMDGTPKGMFKKGGAISVWISNDAERLPLKFEVKVKVGTATATLTDYQPPTSAAGTVKAPVKTPAAPAPVGRTARQF